MTAKVSRWLNWQPRRLQAPESAKSAESGNFVVFVGRGVGDSSKIEGQCVSHGLSHNTPEGPDGGNVHAGKDVESYPRIIQKVASSEPTKTSKPPVEQRRASALAFVNQAAARIVCPDCYPGCPAGAKFAILVPAVNDTAEFQDSVERLGLSHLPVLHREVPLGYGPVVQYVPKRSCGGVSEERRAKVHPRWVVNP